MREIVCLFLCGRLLLCLQPSSLLGECCSIRLLLKTTWKDKGLQLLVTCVVSVRWKWSQQDICFSNVGSLGWFGISVMLGWG